MAAVGIPFHGSSSMIFVDGAFAFVDPVQQARRRDSVAKKRGRGENLVLDDEAEARGWSSAVPERSLALRRRRGPASSSCRRGCVAVAEAQACRGEEAVPEVIGAKIKETERDVVDGEARVDADGEEFFYLAVL